MRWMRMASAVAACGVSAGVAWAGAGVTAGAGGWAGGGGEPEKGALEAAVRQGDGAKVAALLKEGANPEAMGSSGVTVLAAALSNGDLEVLRALAAGGVDLSSANYQGFSAMDLALLRYKPPTELIRFLIEQKVKVKDGMLGASAALMQRGSVTNPEVLRLFIDQGVDVNGKSDEGSWCPLAIAAVYGTPDAVRMLLDAKARAAGDMEHGLTPMHSVGMRGEAAGTAEIVQMLVKAGGEVNGTDDWERTPLCIAVHDGSLPAVRALLDAGADPNVGGYGGQTPLILASIWQDAAMVKLLLDHKADVKPKDVQGRTALEWAIVAADPGQRQAWTAGGFGAARMADRAEASLSIPDVLRVIDSTQPEEKIRALLAAGADPNASSDGEWSALSFAAILWDHDAIRQRTEQKADQRTGMSDWAKWEEFRSKHDAAAVVRALVDAGAVRIEGSARVSALDVAMRRGDEARDKIVEMLRAVPVKAAPPGAKKRKTGQDKPKF